MIHALIDGDWILYAAGFAGQKTKLVCPHVCHEHEFGTVTELRQYIAEHPDMLGRFNDDTPVYQRFVLDPDAHFFHSAKNMIQSKCDEIEKKFRQEVIPHVYIDGDGNFRNKIATIKPYKGQRSVHAKPLKYNDIRQYLLDHWNPTVCYDQETDDEIAIQQTLIAEAGDKSIIVSVDKDFLQVPGWHYNPNKGFKNVGEREALERQYVQCLTGDSVDNIRGCFKVGPVAAKKIILGIKTETGMWGAVLTTYAKSVEQRADKYNGLTAVDAALENMRLIYLRRQPGEIWMPPEV